jgi:Ca-activated chloride channel family protein
MAAPVEAEVASPPAVMIVFDGSGSMWGRLEGEKVAKFVTAREALKPLLGKADPRIAFGLTTFGARRQADCTDATVAVPLEPGSEKIVGLLERYNPKGKSPLTLALREAVKAMPASGPRSLILVHDDLDNCSLDPCALAADLPPAGSGLTIHAVGLAIRPEDAQRLQCLTARTGGRLFDAQTPAAVATHIEEALRLAMLATPPPPAAPAAPPAPATAGAAGVGPASPAGATAPVQRPALRTDGRPGIRLATVLQAGQAPRTAQPQFVIRRTDAAVSEPPVFSGRGQDLQVPLPVGSYVVEAQDGLVSAAPQTFTVPERGQIAVDIPLGAGLLVTPPAAMAAEAEAVVALFRREGDRPAGAPLAMVAAAETVSGLALPPGRYMLRLADGNLRQERPIDVAAGGTLALPGPWPFGRLQLSIGGTADRAAAPVMVVVYEDDPDASRGRREVVRSAAVNPDLALPAGTYTVIVRQGAVEARDRLVVPGGQVVRRTLALAGARLTLASRLAGLPATAASNLSDEPVAYRIERLDVVPTQVFTAHRAVVDLDLPAGRYRVEARHGLVNARTTREVTLGAGEALALTLEHPAGSIRFVGPPRTGEALWELLDATGDPLWSSAQATPRVTLRAGPYVVRLETRERRIERRFEVRAGDVRTLEVTE